jgi:hypothetical protein
MFGDRARRWGFSVLLTESAEAKAADRDKRLAQPTDVVPPRPDAVALADGGGCQPWFEILLILGLFFLFAGCPPPDVNEAHYLAKAKHYWNPDWCNGDVFLESADAHLTFYWAFGWLTKWFSLPVVAWIGRWTTWGLLAWAWQRLSTTIIRLPFSSVLTAAWLVLLLEYFHLAGEWVVGGVEAKGIAFVLVFFGFRAMLLGRWRAIWLWLGGASAFHVLVGGWSVLIALGVWWSLRDNRPPLFRIFPSLIFGGLLSLPGLLPAIWLSSDVSPEVARLANEIYVFGRLGHHLSFGQFSWDRRLLFALLCVAWLGMTWQLSPAVRQGLEALRVRFRRLPGWLSYSAFQAAEGTPLAIGQARWLMLNRFATGALLLACLGVTFDWLLRGQPDLAARILRLYWFRAADFAVPVLVSLAIPLMIAGVPCGLARVRTVLWALAIVAPSFFFVAVFVQHQRDFRPRAELQSRSAYRIGIRAANEEYEAWRNACLWIREHTPEDATFLTPRNQQTFKWHAERSEVASWKDIPQDAESIMQWWYRLQDIYPMHVQEGGLGAWTDAQLRSICRHYRVDYILVDRSVTTRRLGFPRIYPNRSLSNASYELYDVHPRPAARGNDRAGK